MSARKKVKESGTPGPWNVVRGKHNDLPVYYIYGKDGEYVAEAHGRKNAFTIAAAPDLLAALKDILNVPCMNLDEMEPSEIAARKKGWAAITRAGRKA